MSAGVKTRNLSIGGYMRGIDALEENWKSEENFPQQFGAASEYALKMAKRPLSYFRDRVKNIGISGQRVLDAGCGTGNWSFGLLSVFDEVYGIDYVKERTDLCTHIAGKYGIDKTAFREGNILETGFPDDFFDVVFCFGVIIVPQTPLDVALKEFRRVVKPGGEIFICLNAPGWAYYLASSDAQARSDLGKKGIYVYLRHALKELPELITTDSKKRQALLDESSEGTRSFLLTAERLFGDQFTIADTITRITEDCGEDYRQRFADELKKIITGELSDFEQLSGYPATYDPNDVAPIIDELGLKNFTWAEEGRMIRAEKANEMKPIYAGSFDGLTANWEFIVERPQL